MRVFGDLLEFTRRDILRDAAKPYLWSDEALCECIAQAHDEFAERTLMLRDSTSIAASFELEVGVDAYVLHPAVQAVLSAKIEEEPQGLIRAGAPTLKAAARGADPRGAWTPRSRTSPSRAFVTR